MANLKYGAVNCCYMLNKYIISISSPPVPAESRRKLPTDSSGWRRRPRPTVGPFSWTPSQQPGSAGRGWPMNPGGQQWRPHWRLFSCFSAMLDWGCASCRMTKEHEGASEGFPGCSYKTFFLQEPFNEESTDLGRRGSARWWDFTQRLKRRHSLQCRDNFLLLMIFWGAGFVSYMPLSFKRATGSFTWWRNIHSETGRSLESCVCVVKYVTVCARVCVSVHECSSWSPFGSSTAAAVTHSVIPLLTAQPRLNSTQLRFKHLRLFFLSRHSAESSCFAPWFWLTSFSLWSFFS